MIGNNEPSERGELDPSWRGSEPVAGGVDLSRLRDDITDSDKQPSSDEFRYVPADSESIADHYIRTFRRFGKWANREVIIRNLDVIENDRRRFIDELTS